MQIFAWGGSPASRTAAATAANADLKAVSEKATSKEEILSAMDKAQSVVGEILQAAQMGAASGGAGGHQHGENCEGSCGGEDCQNKPKEKGIDGPLDADPEDIEEKK
ncbi:hypothetical protein R83H12_02847 [Fibrobacteria bacterium R8-3-H12]